MAAGTCDEGNWAHAPTSYTRKVSCTGKLRKVAYTHVSCKGEAEETGVNARFLHGEVDGIDPFLHEEVGGRAGRACFLHEEMGRNSPFPARKMGDIPFPARRMGNSPFPA